MLDKLIIGSWWIPLAVIAGIGLLPVGHCVWQHTSFVYQRGRLRIYVYVWRIRIRLK